MRIITTIVTVYRYDELSDEAKQAAVRNVSGKLTGDWWDSHDNDRLGETIVYAFAGELHSPGWDTFGEGDFPGIGDITLSEWDLGRAQECVFKGTLTRDNAPALPWVDGIESVLLHHPDMYRQVWVEVGESGETEAVTDGQIAVMREAVDNAVQEAWRAGHTEFDYMHSDEYARDWIEVDEPEFTVDGQLYR